MLGLRDFIDKNGMPSVVLGLSGGIDSALVAALAVDALGADRVHGVGLPSKWSSEHSPHRRRGPRHSGWGCTTPSCRSRRWSTPSTASVELTGVAAENLQARVRGTLLMGLSNQHGHLLLTTGNKSEVAVGYSTLYGDAAGGFAPIKDVPKTLVWELARWRNDVRPPARRDRADPAELASTSRRPPSSRPASRTATRCPPTRSSTRSSPTTSTATSAWRSCSSAGTTPQVVAKVLRLVDTAEFKRRQSAPGTKISLKAFGRDRRLPITNRWRETPAQVREGAARRHDRVGRLRRAVLRPRARAPPAAGQGARREVGDAHRLRHLQRGVFEEAGIPVLLVGDSAGNVVLGLHAAPCR